MKCGVRFKVLVGFTLFVTLTILLVVLEDKCETYDPIAYIQASIPWFQDEEDTQPAALGGQLEDKLIVIPALEEDDVSWVTEDLSDWQHAVYTVNPSSRDVQSDRLTTPLNKGHEAMAYLTYIIDNYNGTIPSVVAFLHAHRGGFFKAWHVDTPLHDNVYAVRHLQLDYVKEQGYANMRCNINPGCKSGKLKMVNPHVTADIWEEVLGNTSTPLFSQDFYGPAAISGVSALEDKERLTVMQPRVWAPCCAQFAVSREQIYARPLEDYIQIRQWIIETERSDAESGRTMEYLWHVIFGQRAIDCPEEKTCYCRLYGRC